MASRKRYAIVGIGSRSYMYLRAIASRYTDSAELVALCDSNETRMRVAQEVLSCDYNITGLSTYLSTQFDEMIRDARPDVVIVTSIDRTHDFYICRAMELGCDVITEKPMTTTDAKVRAIRETMQRTGRDLRVTFNYRYAPRNTKIRELIAGGEIGDVQQVHFEWVLDTRHGADYFRRWHRDKRNSGGLMVHKSTHHFDLVNWWTASKPLRVFAFGKLGFYGRENAERRGLTKFYERAHGSQNAVGDPFALHMEKDEELKRMYLDAEWEDGYQRDQSVFGYNISIEDTAAVTALYDNGAQLSYSLVAYAPWEGYRVMFTGTGGRLEAEVVERGYLSGASDDPHQIDTSQHTGVEGNEGTRITLQRLWNRAEQVEVQEETGGHGGGDVRMLDDIFLPEQRDDPLGRAAGFASGALSVLTGVAANRAMASGMPVDVADLLKDPTPQP